MIREVRAGEGGGTEAEKSLEEGACFYYFPLIYFALVGRIVMLESSL